MRWISRFFRPVIDVRRPVRNRERQFGEATAYYRLDVICMDGRRRAALLTDDQITKAVARALRNPEDSLW